jgi:YVTN family beta-propeller protein
VSVIDGATNTVTTTIGVGNAPVAVGVDPATNTAYVTNENDRSVSVIDGATNTVTTTIGVSRAPVAVGVDPATSTAYVANGNSVSVIAPAPPPCPSGTKANFRWHYTANGNAGGWSGTATQHCPGSVSMGPQAMGGNLQVAPGATLQAGYDFTLPGNKNSLTMTVSAAQVTFAVACVSGATPSASTLTVIIPAQTYQITNDQWYPSGDQSSPLVYQGSVPVPDLCGGGKISLAKGGTFTATLG